MPDLKIQITANGGQAAAEEVNKLTAATKGAAAATTEHGKESGKAADLLQQLGARGGESRHLIEGLEMASQGGTRGIMGMAKALFYAREAFSIGALTIFGGALLALIPTFIEWGKKLFDTGKAAEDAGAKFETLKKSAEEMGKGLGAIDVEKFKESLTEIEHNAQQALSRLEAIQKIRDELASEKMATEIARVKAGGGSDEEKADRIANIRQRYEAEKDQSRIGGIDKKIGIAKGAYDETQQQIGGFEKRRDEMVGQVGQYSVALGQRSELEQQRDQAQARLDSLTMTMGLPGGSAIDPAAIAAAAESIKKINEQLAKLTSADEATRKIIELTSRLSELGKQLDEAKKHADQIGQKTVDQAVIGGIEKQGITAVGGARTEKEKAEGAAEARERLKKIAPELEKFLPGLGYSAAPFDARFYHDPQALERDRGNYDRGITRDQGYYDKAKQHAEDLATKLGSGKGGPDDLKELADLLERMLRSAAQKTELTDVIRRLRIIENRMANGDSHP